MSNPYESAPANAFWRSAIAEREPLQIAELWDPKFGLKPAHKVATMGSCFAQHFGRELKARGYNWFDAERAPDIFSPAVKKKYNYGVFSARTGNVYTAAALRQWVHWALGIESPPSEIWEKHGRYIDPFRPAIEPEGFASTTELLASRAAVLRAMREIISKTHRFVFTLGLTEGWINRSHGYNYAACPGTIAGTFDPSVHEFKNYNFNEIYRDLNKTIASIRSKNPKIRILLTVSPVPLVATASGKHVLTATTYSKSVLRAVAGLLADTHAAVDYFPSYEMITGTPFEARFYGPNKRDVSADGVKFVMDSFFAGLTQKFGTERAAVKKTNDGVSGPDAEQPPPLQEQFSGDDEIVCEEQMLEAFSR